MAIFMRREDVESGLGICRFGTFFTETLLVLSTMKEAVRRGRIIDTKHTVLFHFSSVEGNENNFSWQKS